MLSDNPNRKKQSAKDWFLRGLDMAMVPFTDPARAWSGFRKDVLNIKGGFTILLIVVSGFIVHEVDSCGREPSSPETHNAEMTNTTNSAQLQHSTMAATGGSGNVQFQGGMYNPQAPLTAPNSVFNYYNMPTSNTVTRDAFEAFEDVVSNGISNATQKIVFTTQQVQLLAQALRDLDQRTSDMQKLPDGRTQFGSIITGQPKVVIEAARAGDINYRNGNFFAALEHYQQAINAVESTKPSNVSMENSGVSIQGLGELYFVAGICAQQIGSNNIANDYAEKANKDNPNYKTTLFLSTTLSKLAMEEHFKTNITASYQFLQGAISNYESVATYNTNYMFVPFQSLVNLYGNAILTSIQLGKTNEAILYETNLSKIIGISEIPEIIQKAAGIKTHN